MGSKTNHENVGRHIRHAIVRIRVIVLLDHLFVLLQEFLLVSHDILFLAGR